jgi:hypothetical protein
MKKYQKAAKIDEIFFNEIVKKGVESTLIVKGYLGDPSWKLLPETVVFDEKQRKVSIKLIAEKDPNAIAIQVIKEFEKDIPLLFNLAGKWFINCNMNILELDVEEESV